MTQRSDTYTDQGRRNYAIERIKFMKGRRNIILSYDQSMIL